MTIDEKKLNDFMGKVVGDVGAAMSAALVAYYGRWACGWMPPSWTSPS